MDTNRRQRLHELFDRAIAQAPADRADWLARLAGDDAALRPALIDLLEADAQAHGTTPPPVAPRIAALLHLTNTQDSPSASPVARRTPLEYRICTQCAALGVPGRATCERCGGSLRIGGAHEFVGQSFGSYLLTGVLGMGGMGVVYAARHRRLDQPAAVKLVQPQDDASGFDQRFVREARWLAALKHPGVVGIYDYDVDPRGIPWYAMEYLEGASLAELRRRHGPLPLAVVGRILGELGEALDHAHALGVVHRDLKTDNVFLARQTATSARLKLLDFGIAKRVDEHPDAATRLTASGLVIGTPLYLAPEQIEAQPVTPATDQYALALIVAELLIGEAWRHGMSLTRIASVEIHAPLDLDRLPAGLPESLRLALARATEPRASERHASVAAFVRACALPIGPDLQPLLPPAQTSSAPPPGTPPPDTPWPAPAPVASTPPAAVVVTQPSPAAPAGRAAGAPPHASGNTRRLQRAVLAGSVLLLVLLLWWTMSRFHADPPAAAPEVAAGTVLWSGAMPADARRVLGADRDLAAVETDGGWWLQPLGGGGTSSRIALPPGASVVGMLDSHELVVHEPPLLRAQDLRGQQRRTLATLPALRPMPEPAGSGGPERRLWIAPDGRHLVLREPDHLALLALTPAAPQEVARLAVGVRGRLLLDLSDHDLAWFDPASASLHLHALADGQQRWAAALEESRVKQIAIDAGGGRVVAIGWFPQVRAFALHDGRALPPAPVQGNLEALASLPDGRIALAGSVGLQVLAASGPATALVTTDSRLIDLRWDAGRLLVLDQRSGQLQDVALGHPPVQSRHPLVQAEIWSLARAADGRVLAGASDGQLLELVDGQPRSHRLHADGITDLVVDGGFLASASDDKTIAVWDLASMQPAYRSRGHDFLVNQLALDPGGAGLWSSSHDGQLKRWSWPDLGSEETIDLNTLGGAPQQLHALWWQQDGSQALVGTWNQRLLHLERRTGTGGPPWQMRALPIASRGGYRLLGLPDSGAVLLVSVEPSRLYLYDLETRGLRELPGQGADWMYAAPGLAAGQVWLGGTALVGRLEVRREADRELAWTVRAQTCSGLGNLGVLLPQVRPGELQVANERGQLYTLDVSALEGSPAGLR